LHALTKPNDPCASTGARRLIVAGRSARLMAEAARREGFRVIALDAFGDVDTLRAAHRWAPIGAGPAGQLDAQGTLAALQSEALTTECDGDAPLLGWVAGSDFECEPALLAEAAAALPLIGTAPPDVRRVRDPAVFFATLQGLGLPHPPTRFDPPADAAGWLRKLGRGCGGWHIRHATGAPPVAADREPYFQREAPGQPMSALFVAHAPTPQGAHRLIGFNELIVRPLGVHPHVYRGAVGPVALPAEAAGALAAAIDALVGAFALRGLCSLDFLWHQEQWALLEINPRPSATMALFAHWPLMQLHVAACRGSRPEHSAMPPAACSGIETVFARRAFRLEAEAAATLAARDDCHDIPHPGATFAAGDPVCSVSAVGNNAAGVREKLADKRRMLRAAWSARH
jgi:predicted ATP-grasp superfamily ATP-dependent carboligase